MLGGFTFGVHARKTTREGTGGHKTSQTLAKSFSSCNLSSKSKFGAAFISTFLHKTLPKSTKALACFMSQSHASDVPHPRRLPFISSSRCNLEFQGFLRGRDLP